MVYADQYTSEQAEEILANGAVGIDLGTTYSAVASITDSGSVEVLSNADGQLTTPSVVLFDEDGTTIVGEQAKEVGQGQAEGVVDCAKRAMGIPDFEYRVGGQIYTPIGISAIILNKLVKDAAERLGREVKSAVITVPAWFNDHARQATLQAGQLAKLNVLGILSEPTAAALAYGTGGQTGKTALVYDLGGGTFDVSIIRIEEDGSTTELARDGDVELGGKDWDQTIVDRLCEAFSNEHGQELPEDGDAYMTLVVQAEKAKIHLTEASQSRVFTQHEGRKTTCKITRQEFDAWTAPLLARTEDTVNVVLQAGEVTPDQIDVVLPVGGATKMPQVRDLLERLFPGKADHSVAKDHVVAIGACLYMAKKVLGLMGDDPLRPDEGGTGVNKLPPATRTRLDKTKLVEVSPRTYGIRVLSADETREYNDHFVKTRQELPVEVDRTYATVEPDQPEVVIRLLEGDSEEVGECKPLKDQTCRLPDGLPKGSPLELKFLFTPEGMIRITLFEPSTGMTDKLEHTGVQVSREERAAVERAIKATE